ncbi:lytic murein transglycosylase [Zavarzinia sp. CC-PAN008]|uniref:lytic murein transglycosylase n=1 Tax=Zavarzinia sp. CC-PAN008 TaxID=3243332 RepID=UPI003F7483E1
MVASPDSRLNRRAFTTLLLASGLAGCATASQTGASPSNTLAAAPQAVPPARPGATATLAAAPPQPRPAPSPAAPEKPGYRPLSELPDFDTWLEDVRQEALGKGFSASLVEEALGNIQPIQRVIELDRRQPERTITWEKYRSNAISQARINRGRAHLEENAGVLNQIGQRFGVQPRFIIALWGLETDFGRNTGGFEIISSLATLAWEGRRADFFRGELFAALRILQEEGFSATELTGSWAGAMGQCQFMPSSFHKFAYDWNGDGHRDIWKTRVDVFASIANYLGSSGWKGDQTWGRQVMAPAALARTQSGLDTRRSLEEWQSLGVTRETGEPLPLAPLSASLVTPSGPTGPHYLVYDNFRTTMLWNRSTYFALAVGTLADAVGSV